jgi:hypothetical protein
MRFTAVLASLKLLTVSLCAQVPSYVPTDGLVGWWPFSGNANDLSGNGYDGSVTGATLANDRLGVPASAYSFNGVNNYIQLGPNPFTEMDQLDGSDYSISLWFQHNDSTGATFFMNFGWGIHVYGSLLELTFGHVGMWPNNQWFYISPDLSTSTDTWYNLVAVKNGTTQEIFINGLIMNSAVSDPSGVGNRVYVGGNPVDNNGWLNGFMDDIGIWNRALTPTEIEALYSAGSAPCISPFPVSFIGLGSSYLTTDEPVALAGTPAGGVFIGPGINGSTFGPAAAGEGTHSISYTYLDDENCVNTFSLCTSVSLGMGLEPGGGTLGGVRVFPNPNRGQFTVELELSGLVSMQVFDARGALVHSEVFNASGTRTQHTLELRDPARGRYSLQIQNAGATITQQLIIE